MDRKAVAVSVGAGVFVAAAMVANLLLARFGPVAAVPVGFGLIGLDLVLRDLLHERLGLRGTLVLAGLGAAGAVLMNPDALRIGLASGLAFGLAFTLDGLAFRKLRSRPWLVRSNGSNVPAAVVDSTTFLLVAFGLAGLPFVPLQIAVKVLGGAAWSLVLAPFRRKVPNSSLLPATPVR